MKVNIPTQFSYLNPPHMCNIYTELVAPSREATCFGESGGLGDGPGGGPLGTQQGLVPFGPPNCGGGLDWEWMYSESRLGIRTELKGVCFSPSGTPPFDPIDLLLKGMHCLKCTLWVSETYHTTEVKTAQRGLRTGSKQTPLKTPQMVQYHFWRKSFLTHF